MSQVAVVIAGIALTACAGTAGAEVPPFAPPTPQAEPVALPELPLSSLPAAPLVEATLVASVEAIRAGEPFQLGVLLTIQRGWHVYWRNPGDAGMATSVEFRLPEGFRAGPLNWPVPATFRQAGDIIGYGYEGSVLLWADVTPPPKLPAGQIVLLRAAVAWLSCRVECAPGEAALELPLKAAETAPPANAALFQEWRQRLPVPAGQAKVIEKLRVRGAIPRSGNEGRFEIVAKWAAPAPEQVDWCPAAPAGLLVEKAAVQTKGAETRITFTARRLAGVKAAPTPVLETILVRQEEGKPPVGILVNVPLDEAGPATSPSPNGHPAAR